MQYADFELVMSAERMSRYKLACGGDTRKAQTLYRHNLRLSQEMFTIISCFEVALRNKIDQHFIVKIGDDWLRTGVLSGGFFDNRNCDLTARSINDAITKLGTNYSHCKLVAELGFGFWRYIFAPHQFRATGRNLLSILPNKPRSTRTTQYNHTTVFNELAALNHIRNRIAHHEPICFSVGHPSIDTGYTLDRYEIAKKLFHWMGIDSEKLLFGLDHVFAILGKINRL